VTDARRIGVAHDHGEAPHNRWGGLWHVTTSGDRHWLSKDVCFECTATPEEKAQEATNQATQWFGPRRDATETAPSDVLGDPDNRWGGLWHVTTSGDRHWLSKDVCFECTATPAERKVADAQWDGMRPGFDVWWFGPKHVTATGFRHRGSRATCRKCNPALRP
jgi:hypothetical protein